VYFEQDVAFLRLFDRYRLNDQSVLPFSDADHAGGYGEDEVFFSRLARGNLPAVTFIDPNYVDIPPDRTANDDHPPADVKNGQELVRRIYNALIQSPTWEKTLFVITYDEHGGFFDHVPPPGTSAWQGEPMTVPKVHPDGPSYYGARVPALVISPWVPRSNAANSTVFDHTSLIKTILVRFGDGTIPDQFGERVRQANHLGALLTNSEPRRDIRTIGAPQWADATYLQRPEEAAPELLDFHKVIQQFVVPQG
jgi:phospholipase C